MNSLNDIWNSVLAVLGQNLTATALNTWFDDCTPVEIVNNRLVIHTPTEFKRDIIQSRFAQTIIDALSDLFSAEFKLTILAGDELDSYISETKTDDTLPEVAGFTFDNFVVGPSNKYAHAAAIAVAENPGKLYNPLFIYGNSGLGKTHLLLAIGSAIHAKNPKAKIVYVKGDDFTNDLVHAIQVGGGEDLRAKYRSADLLLMDDIQFIAGKNSVQEEFFHTFNTLYEAKKQIVLTSDRPPRDIATLEDRLKTRFEWGLTADVQPPDFETRIAIIARKAESLHLDIPESVCEYIANKLKSNIRQLEGAVKKLRAYHLLENKPINIATAQAAISDIINNSQPTPVTVDKIIEEVARTYGGITPEDIRSQKRNANISKARQVSMYIVREITQMSMVEIGQTFGGRDHSTVVYAVRQVEKDLKKDPHTKAMVDDIIKNIRDR